MARFDARLHQIIQQLINTPHENHFGEGAQNIPPPEG